MLHKTCTVRMQVVTCLSLATRRSLCRGVSVRAICSRSNTTILASNLCASLSTEAAEQADRHRAKKWSDRIARVGDMSSANRFGRLLAVLRGC